MSQNEQHYFCSLFSAGGFCLVEFLPPPQVDITSLHLFPCLSVLWCDTAKCVKYRKASLVPEEQLSVSVTSIHVPVLLVLVTWTVALLVPTNTFEIC